MQRAIAAVLLGLSCGLTQAADSIRVYNWNDYIAPQVLENFTRDTGIEVEYHTFASAEELAAALQSGQSIDIAVPSHNDLPGLIASGRIRPLDFNGIWGIVTAPLLHANFEHLMSNSVPGAIFCFLIGLSGRKAWWEVTLITTLVAGLGTWFIGGPGTSHIGASSLVYGWLAYLIVRGIFNRSLIQTILGIVLGFAYSGLVWGVLPVYEGVSWQGHLFGAIGGILAGMTITSDDPVKAVKR